MRLLLCCLALTACDATPMEPTRRTPARLTIAWDSTLAVPQGCVMREVGSVLWVGGMKYWEILFVCD